MSTPPSLAPFTLHITESAGRIVSESRKEGVTVSFKDRLNLVTDFDLRVEQFLIDSIRERFPDHAILSEETNTEIQPSMLHGPLWIIDPIDGTTNFAHGMPHTAVSVAFAEHGEVQVGCVCAPFLGETYFAVRGEGATLNGVSIQCDSPEHLEDTLVTTGFPYLRDELEPIMKRARAVLSRCRDLRRLGAASLDISWVGCGRLGGFYEDLAPWDVAAALLIASESGAELARFLPQPKAGQYIDLPPSFNGTNVIVAPKSILEQLTTLLNEAVV